MKHMTHFATKSITIAMLIALTVGAPLEALAANLIQNADFETVDPVDSTAPQYWTKGYQGSGASSTYTYPVAGRNSASAAHIEVDNASYQSGDVKWLFKDVEVTAGESYIYSGYYKSNAVTDVLVRYNTSTGTQPGNCPAVESDCAYQNLGAPLPVSADWTQFESLFVVPMNATSLTVFHALKGNTSSLDTTSVIDLDDVSLTEDTQATIVDHVPNYSVETAVFGGLLPKAWQSSSYGDNTSAFEYVTNDGHQGSKSVKVTMSNYISGDAKWFFAPQPVAAGDDYLFTAWYKVDSLATKPQVVAQYTHTNGDISYFGMPYPEPTGTGWEQYKAEFSVPTGVENVTVFFYLAGNGSVTTDDYHITPYTYTGFDDAIVTITFDDGAEENVTTALPIINSHNFKTTQCYMSGAVEGVPAQIADVLAFKNGGHEICAHSVSHPDLTTVNQTQLEYELLHSREYLESVTGLPVPNFATPYGAYDTNVINAIKNVYSSHRTVNEGYNSKDNLDVYRLKVQNMTASTTLAEYQEWVTKAKQDKLWLILVYHIVTNGTPGEFDTSTADFTAQMNYLQGANIQIKRYDDALATILKPVISPKENVVVEATSPLGAIVNYSSPTSTTPIVCTPASGSQFAQGTTAVNCIATTTIYTATSTFNVVVQDTTAPVLTLLGTDPQGIALGAPYVEQGATAIDGRDGDISTSIVINSSNVNTHVAGTYTVAYSVTDAGGHTSTASRSVEVAQSTIEVTATAQTKTFGSADPVLAYTITSGGLISGDSFTGALTRAAGEATGTYAITIGTLNAPASYAMSFVPSSLTIVSPTCTSKQTLVENVCVNNKKSSGGGGSSGSKKKKVATTTTIASTTKSAVLGAATSTPSAPKFIFTLPLSVGSTGNEVTELQKRLTLLGVYTGPITGYFGPLTRAGVVALQAKNGLPQVGLVGPLTRAVLNK